MLCLIVPGVGFWPLGYVCLVPWLVCVCSAEKARTVYFVSYLLGLSFFLICVRWMAPVTLPGYCAMGVFFAFQFPLTAWPIRHVYLRRGLPVSVAAPIAWVAFEYLRCIGPLGFPMILLGHSQYRVLTVIQISDLVGAPGLSFLLAMVNGWFADLLIQPIVVPREEKTVRLPLGTWATGLVVVGTVVYGVAQSSTRDLTPGPRIAMIQNDIPMYVDREQIRRSPSEAESYAALGEMTDAALEKKPDVIVMPETAVGLHLNDEFLTAGPDTLQEILQRAYSKDWSLNDLRDRQRRGKQARAAYQKICDRQGVSFVLGATALYWQPTAIPPRTERFNSAYLFRPGRERPVARYDKRHLVLFGEFVPFRFSIPWLYDWLNSLTPWGASGRHFSLSPGDHNAIFEFRRANGAEPVFRAGAPICYEEIMPYIPREFTRGQGPGGPLKAIDLLLPISNDGWFLYSTELEQHLAAGVFRAVENRIAVARAVNTGASAMIYPNGKIHCRVALDAEHVAELSSVEAILNRARSLVEAVRSSYTEPDSFNEARRQLAVLFTRDLVKAYRAVGPGFSMYAERLDRFRSNLGGSASVVNQVSGFLTQQIDDDLASIRRWRARPDTAPGIAVDQALLDGRLTLYTRYGDVFAVAMMGLTGLALLDWGWVRFRRGPQLPLAA